MIPSLTNIENGIEIGGLARSGQHGSRPTLEGPDLVSDRIIGRVLQAGVKIARFLEIEQPPHLVAGIVFERGALVDRQLPGFTFGRLIPCMDTLGFDSV